MAIARPVEALATGFDKLYILMLQVLQACNQTGDIERVNVEVRGVSLL
jgi:hypothetical protein